MSNKTKEMFVVICDYDGNFDVIGTKNTIEEAYALMEKDYNEFIEETKPEDYFIGKDHAWAGEDLNGETCNWYIDKINVPVEEKKNPLDDVMRIDFEKWIGPHRIPQALFFNTNTISEEEIRELIISGEYETDKRVIVMHPNQFDNVFGKK